MAVITDPNLYELSYDGVLVTYSTTSINGTERFSFRDGQREINAAGDDVSKIVTEIGTLVTVTAEVIPDLRTVTISLLVPDINLGSSSEVEFDTAVVETVQHTSIGGPALVDGPLQTYRFIELHGTAKSVDFLVGQRSDATQSAE